MFYIKIVHNNIKNKNIKKFIKKIKYERYVLKIIYIDINEFNRIAR